MYKKRRNTVTAALQVVLLILLIAQAIPYGRSHDNPPVVREPAWDSASTRALAKRACFDCHSHETVWPWYSHIAPVSWLLQYDVNEGRRKLNFSDWQNGARKGERPEEIRETMNEGEMPPFLFQLIHKSSRLSDGERKSLTDSLTKAMPQGNFKTLGERSLN